MSERIEKLKQAVELRFKGEARHLESIPVRLEYKGSLVWEGVVEVFNIPETNHSVRCYAWENHTEEGIEYVTVRKTAPRPMTPIEAVQLWIGSMRK